MYIVGKASAKSIRTLERFGCRVKGISTGTFNSIADQADKPDPHDPDGGLDPFRDERYVAVSMENVDAIEGVKRVLDVRNQE